MKHHEFLCQWINDFAFPLLQRKAFTLWVDVAVEFREKIKWKIACNLLEDGKNNKSGTRRKTEFSLLFRAFMRWKWKRAGEGNCFTVFKNRHFFTEYEISYWNKYYFAVVSGIVNELFYKYFHWSKTLCRSVLQVLCVSCNKSWHETHRNDKVMMLKFLAIYVFPILFQAYEI